jgi:ABC-type lipoprotein export system ATPase subunit
MISAIDITKTYAGQDGTITALDGVSFKVQKGDFIAVIGRSGTGKSTLLGVTGGLLKPSGGEVFLDGQSIWDLDEQLRAQIRAQKIGFVFQNASVISSLTVLENVVLAQSFLPKQTKADISQAMNLIESVGLTDRIHAYPEQLSGGEKRRVAIASALMNDPALLLADEPTGDLDSETESEIMSLFLNLWQNGTTIIMVTHNQQLASCANRILTMDDGLITESAGQNRVENSFS